MNKALFGVLALLTCMGVYAQQPIVAVAPFEAISGISATDANMITRVFFIRLGNTGKVSLVDRGVVERVLQEHQFQAGDWSNTQKTAELGTALNAEWIVRGEMEKFGSNILVTVQFYDIRTFRFMGGADLRLANADEAYDKMDPLVDKLVQTIAASPVGVSPARPAAPAGKTYNIGDFGPAGGIVFYDKGVFSNGWRYLEAAPAETEFTGVQWGALGQDVSGTGLAVGSGKRNTELIVERLKARGESGRAAQLCASLNFDGFTDWFLPSKDELNLMYQNLHRKGLGGFTSTGSWTRWYLSSSQIDSNRAWPQSFENGGQEGSNSKDSPWSVRAIRSF
jgi:TolB-like protein